jgi:uncharacterized protein (UPF0297 family)
VSEVICLEFDKTMRFAAKPENLEASKAFQLAYQALSEKGYNPIYQIAGYLISGDPAYITNHLDARNTIRRIERDELIEELVRAYAETHRHENPRR